MTKAVYGVYANFIGFFRFRATLRHELSWSHYRLLMKIENEERCEFYGRECAESSWGVRQLERQINSFFYERLLATQQTDRAEARNEILGLEPNNDPKYILKDPYILEFLDLKENRKYKESGLESALIDHLQDFLLELGKGFSFVARQKRMGVLLRFLFGYNRSSSIMQLLLALHDFLLHPHSVKSHENLVLDIIR